MNSRLRNHRTYTKALYQLSSASSLNGIIEPIIGMPDLTPSYGLPVGGILATGAEDGDISLNAIGGDINCGISLSKTNIDKSSFFENNTLDLEKCKHLSKSIKSHIDKRVYVGDTKEVLLNGATSLCSLDELNKIENYGVAIVNLEHLIDEKIQTLTKKQLGSLGNGNHFIDLLFCEEIYDPELALLFGINQKEIQLMIHSGSRGIGQYIKYRFSDNSSSLFGVEKIFQPRKFMSKQGNEILESVNIASNFAYANRAILRQRIKQALQNATNNNLDFELIYDFGHNNISLEEYKGKQIILHRKGVSRALPKGHQNNTLYYKETGHPIIIPGSIGTPTYVLIGNPELEKVFYSINHGAGRKYVRGYVRKKLHHPKFKEHLENVFINQKYKDFCEESPNAYKDIEEIINTLEINGFVKRVAKLRPFFVYIEKD